MLEKLRHCCVSRWSPRRLRSPSILPAVACLALASFLPAPGAKAAFFYVGPGMPYAKPSEVANVAQDGDVIEIEAGTYRGDVAVWRQDNLVIRGVGGRPHLMAEGKSAQGKAIWVIQGDNTVVDNVEFSGAAVADRNGAGIRQEGSGLTVRNCYFHRNENGILSGRNPASDIVIERSIFDNNGYGDGRSHNLYIGRIKSLTIRHSYIHHARVGHNIKSRAATNYILYNRVMDESDGTSSYAVDLPNGGIAYVIGNLLQQGPRTENSAILSYGTRQASADDGEVYIVNNTFVNDHDRGLFVRVAKGAATVRIVNNIFSGPGRVLEGKGDLEANLTSNAPGLRTPGRYDYRLVPGSPAIDAGVDPGSANGFSLRPGYHYLHAADAEPRPEHGPLDVGAYELAQ